MSELLDRDNFVAAKLAWQRGVLSDKSLTQFAKVFGAQLMHDLHPKKGGAWRSQASLAELLGVDQRTIRRAARELEKAGHLRVEVSRGRGRANFYEPLVQHSEAANGTPVKRSAASPSSAETRTAMSAKRHVWRTAPPGLGAENRADGATWPDTHALPSLSDSFIPPSSPPSIQAGDSGPGGDGLRSGGLSRKEGEPGKKAFTAGRLSAVPPTPRSTFGHVQVRARIVSQIGEPATASYLDPAAWRESDNTIVCRLRIAADTLRSRAAEALRELDVAVVHDAAAHQALTSNIIAFAEVA